jgi:copper chaperone CopZ
MTAPTTSSVELAITGMTCASCANRIERKLNKLDGVTASVNYATEQARVEHAADVDVQVLLDTVAAAGYSASVPTPRGSSEEPAPEHDATRALRDRLVVSAVLGLPVLVLSMVPAAAVRELAVAGAGARRPGRRVGRAALPPRRLDQPAARRRDDGHPHLDRHARRVPVVAVRAVLGGAGMPA